MIEPKVTEIIESALYVTDLESSVDLYVRVLGFKAMSEPTGRLCALSVTENQVLILFRKGASVEDTATPTGTIPGTDGEGSLHVAFGVPEAGLSRWKERLRKSGLETVCKTWPEGGESLYFHDPDGHVLELKTSNWLGTKLGSSRASG